jgi:hypothetical protein
MRSALGLSRFLAAAAALGAALALSAVGASAASAADAAQTLSGSCQFSGSIQPNPPITVVPKPGAHFSYRGSGTCSGAFDGAAAMALPVTVTFTNVATAFDTCEFGPDFNLPGTLAVSSGGISAYFAITINLARLALAGPFVLTTPGGGQAVGTAQFTPPDPAQAIGQCAGVGIGTATLSASFNTLSPLMGTRVSTAGTARPRMYVRWRSRKHRHKGHRKHRHASA